MLVKIGKHVDFCVYRRPYLIWSPVLGCNVDYGESPFRTAVPFSVQIAWDLTGLSPKRDRGSKRVELAWYQVLVECYNITEV